LSKQDRARSLRRPCAGLCSGLPPLGGGAALLPLLLLLLLLLMMMWRLSPRLLARPLPRRSMTWRRR
jgi:hypothetical protein